MGIGMTSYWCKGLILLHLVHLVHICISLNIADVVRSSSYATKDTAMSI